MEATKPLENQGTSLMARIPHDLAAQLREFPQLEHRMTAVLGLRRMVRTALRDHADDRDEDIRVLIDGTRRRRDLDRLASDAEQQPYRLGPICQ